jgi:hypothetical protein
MPVGPLPFHQEAQHQAGQETAQVRDVIGTHHVPKQESIDRPVDVEIAHRPARRATEEMAIGQAEPDQAKQRAGRADNRHIHRPAHDQVGRRPAD